MRIIMFVIFVIFVIIVVLIGVDDDAGAWPGR